MFPVDQGRVRGKPALELWWRLKLQRKKESRRGHETRVLERDPMKGSSRTKRGGEKREEQFLPGRNTATIENDTGAKGSKNNNLDREEILIHTRRGEKEKECEESF